MNPLDVEIPEHCVPPLRRCSPGLRRILLKEGLLSQQELDEGEKLSGNRQLLSRACILRGRGEGEVVQKIGRDLSLQVAVLSGTELQRWSENPPLTMCFTRQFSLQHRAFPLSASDGEIRVVMSDPLDLETIAAIEYETQHRVRVVLSSEGAIVRAILKCLPDEDASMGTEPERAENRSPRGESDLIIDQTVKEKGSSDAHDAPPIVRLVNKVLTDALGAGASDIHLVPTTNALEVKYRVDGVMTHHLSIPKHVQSNVVARVKLLAGMDISEKRRPQDGRFRMKINEQSSRDIRASAVPTPFGESIVLRILRSDTEGLELSKLGMPEEVENRFRQALQSTEQMILVVGPTGSGKTTTLYAGIALLNDGRHTIITVEDPIELKLEGLTQIQVDAKLGITFASGLRSILRQDPDVVLIGEIRDLETAEIGFQAAQTGHLVLSTLHTNDAPSAIVRLMDLGVDPALISASLRGVLAQRLIRRNCPRCKTSLPADQSAKIEERFGVDGAQLSHSIGCDACEGTGFRGRIGVYSYLPMTSEFRDAVRRRAGLLELEAIARRGGMIVLPESARMLLEQGMTTAAEIERVLGFEAVEEFCRQRRVSSPAKTSPAQNTPVLETPIPSRLRGENSISGLVNAESSSPASEKATRSRVLIVDDDSKVRTVLARVLEKEGYEVTEAGDGREALDSVMRAVPDLVLCDLIMPHVNGIAFVTEMKRSDSLRSVPVLMLTGSDDERNEMALLDAGADDFVSKGSSPGVVISRVKRLLRRAEKSPEGNAA